MIWLLLTIAFVNVFIFGFTLANYVQSKINQPPDVWRRDDEMAEYTRRRLWHRDD